MRIKVENLSEEHYYSKMPLPERNFLYDTNMTYENGIHYAHWSPRNNKVYGHIGFDKNGKLFFKPIINTKNVKANLSEKDLIKLFEKIVFIIQIAGENGFIDFEDGKE